MACPQAPELVAAGEHLLPPLERLCAGAVAGAAPLDELDSVLGELAAVTQVLRDCHGVCQPVRHGGNVVIAPYI